MALYDVFASHNVTLQALFEYVKQCPGGSQALFLDPVGPDGGHHQHFGAACDSQGVVSDVLVCLRLPSPTVMYFIGLACEGFIS